MIKSFTYLLFAVLLCLTVFLLQRFSYERQVLNENTWRLYNPVSNNLVFLSHHSRHCVYFKNFDLLFDDTKQGAKLMWRWHRQRVSELQLLNTEDYLARHKRKYKHSQSYLKKVKKQYAQCEFADKNA